MQFQVPQFIKTEDKIVGPFTMRQFLYLGVAGAICFFLYFLVKPWLFGIGSVILIGIALGLGMGQFSGRTLTHLIRSAFGFYWKPQIYLWQPEQKQKTGVSAMERMEAEAAAIRVKPSGIASDALRNAWQSLQEGKISGEQFAGQGKERYQIFQEKSGARQAARRVDYR